MKFSVIAKLLIQEFRCTNFTLKQKRHLQHTPQKITAQILSHTDKYLFSISHHYSNLKEQWEKPNRINENSII